MNDRLSLGPFFTRQNSSKRATTATLASLAIALEWACADQGACVPLYQRLRDLSKLPLHLRVERKQPKLREILCHQGDIPVDVDYLEADALDTPDGKYIPMEALLLALYRRYEPQRHIHEVLREFVELVPLHSSVSKPVRNSEGLLSSEVEQRGYRITTVIADRGLLVADIGWRPTPTSSPIHAGITEFQKDLIAQWLPTAELGVTQLLADDLHRTVGTPDHLLAEKGRQLLTTLLPAGAAKTRQTQKRAREATDGGTSE